MYRRPEYRYMPKKRQYVCSVEAVMDVIGGKWKPHILLKIKDTPLRFGAIQEKLPAISQKMLTRQLRALEADRLISRTEYPGMPLRVEYALTERGADRYPAPPVTERLGERGAGRPDPGERVTGLFPFAGTGCCAGRVYRHFCSLFSCSGENLL